MTTSDAVSARADVAQRLVDELLDLLLASLPSSLILPFGSANRPFGPWPVARSMPDRAIRLSAGGMGLSGPDLVAAWATSGPMGHAVATMADHPTDSSDRRLRPAVVGAARADPAARGVRRAGQPARPDGPAPGRDRHRQGPRRARDPRQRRPRAARPVRRRQLRRHPGDHARGGAVRLRGRRVHRRASAPSRGSSRRPSARHAVPRRDRLAAAALQSKLLKAIEEKRVRRLGAVTASAVDVKLIAATQQRPARAGRRRRASAPTSTTASRSSSSRSRRCASAATTSLLLAEHFLADATRRRTASPPKRLDDDGAAWLRSLRWPGNVRELEPPDGARDAARARRGASARDDARAPAACRWRPAPARRSRPPPADGAAERRGGAHPRRAGARRRQRRARGAAARPRPQRAPLSHAPPRHRAAATLDEPAADPAALAAARRAARRRRRRSRRRGSRSRSRSWRSRDLVAGRDARATSRGPRRGAGSARSRSASRASAGSFVHARAVAPDGRLRHPARARAAAAARRAGGARDPCAPPARRAARDRAPGAARRGARRRGARRHRGAPTPTARLFPIGDTLALPERLLGHAGSRRGPGVAARSRGASSAAATLRAPRQLRPRRRRRRCARTPSSAGGRARRRSPATAGADAVRRPRARARPARDAFDARRGRARPGRFIAGEAGIGKSRLLAEFRRRLGDAAAPLDRGALRLVRHDDAVPADHRRPAALPRHRRPRRRGERERQDRRGASPRSATISPGRCRSCGSCSRSRADDEAVARARLGEPAQRDCSAPCARSRCAPRSARRWSSSSRTCTGSIRRPRSASASSPTRRRRRARCSCCSHRPGYRHPFGDRSYHVRVALRAALAARHGGDDRRAARRRRRARRRCARSSPARRRAIRSSSRRWRARCSRTARCAATSGRIVLARELERRSPCPTRIQDVLIARIDRLADDAAARDPGRLGDRPRVRAAPARAHHRGGRAHPRAGRGAARARAHLREGAAPRARLHVQARADARRRLRERRSRERRRELHRTIGLAIEELYADRLAEHYETLAHHFGRGEDWERALDYHERSAEKAADTLRQPRRRRALPRRRWRSPSASARRVADERRRRARGAPRRCACFYLSEFARVGRGVRARAPRAAPIRRAARRQSRRTRRLSYFWGHRYDARRRCSRRGARARAHARRAAAAEALRHVDARLLPRRARRGDLDGFEQRPSTSARGRSAPTPRRRRGRRRAVRFHMAQMRASGAATTRARSRTASRSIAAGRRLRLAAPHHLADLVPRQGALLPRRLRRAPSRMLSEAARALRPHRRPRLEEPHAQHARLVLRARSAARERAREYNERGAALAREIGDPEILANADINLAAEPPRARRRRAARAASGAARGGAGAAGRSVDALALRAARAPSRRTAGVARRRCGAGARAGTGGGRGRAPSSGAQDGSARARPGRRGATCRGRARRRRGRARRGGTDRGAIGYPRAAWSAYGLQLVLARRAGHAELAARHAARRQALLDGAIASLEDAELRRRLAASTS